MQNDNLLDELSQSEENTSSQTKFEGNDQFKFLALGAIVFYLFMNIKFILESTLQTLLSNFIISPILVYIISQSIAIISVLITTYLYFPRLYKKASSNLRQIDSIIGIHVILLVLFIIINLLYYKILAIFNFSQQVNSGFYFNQEYYSFIEFANPISHILLVLLLVFVILKMKPTSKFKKE